MQAANPTSFEATSSGTLGSEGLLGVAAGVPAEAAVTLPADPSDAIELGSELGVSVGLPFADQANDARGLTAGSVKYDNANGSATVPVVKGDGSLQIFTTIENAAAPNEFTYELDLPNGMELVPTEDGGAIIGTLEGLAMVTIAAPWAKDANGNSLPTSYKIEGTTLTQVVDHSRAAYPVVADPVFAGCTIGGFYPALCITYGQAEVKQAANMVAGTAALGAIAGSLCAKVPGIYQVGCGAAMAAALASGVQNIQIAAENNRCLKFAFSFPPIATLLSGGLQPVVCG